MIQPQEELLKIGLSKVLKTEYSDIRITTLKQDYEAVDLGIHMGGPFSATVPIVSLFYGGFINRTARRQARVRDYREFHQKLVAQRNEGIAERLRERAKAINLAIEGSVKQIPYDPKALPTYPLDGRNADNDVVKQYMAVFARAPRVEFIEVSDGWLFKGHRLDLTFLVTAPNFETQGKGATRMGNDDIVAFSGIAGLKIIDVSYPYQPGAEFEYGILEQKGIRASVYDMPSFDRETMLQFLAQEALTVVAEQNYGFIWHEIGQLMFRNHVSLEDCLALNVSNYAAIGLV